MGDDERFAREELASSRRAIWVGVLVLVAVLVVALISWLTSPKQEAKPAPPSPSSGARVLPTNR